MIRSLNTCKLRADGATSLIFGISAYKYQKMIEKQVRKLKDKLDSQSLSMKDMTNFRKTTDSALAMQGENLNRAKNLIENLRLSSY